MIENASNLYYEKEGQNVFDVIQVPHLKDESSTSKDFLKKNQREIENVDRNLSYLEEVINNNGNCFLDETKNIIKSVRESYDVYYKKRIIGYSTAPLADDLVEDKISKIKKIGPMEADDALIKKILYDDFIKNGGNKVCLSDSHISTYWTLQQVFKAKKNDIKTAIIVFDNHVDLYGDEYYLDKIPWKGNIFKLLGSSKLISEVVFVGGGIDEKFMIQRRNESMKALGRKMSYKQIKIDDIKRDKQQIDRTFLIRQLESTIKIYKKMGIKNVIFSIDLDVLRAKKMGYTALEYTPINMLDYIASLELPLHKNPVYLTKVEINKINKELTIEEKKNRANPLDGPNESWDPSGLRLGDIGISLDIIFEKCRKYGIEIGIDLIGGGKYLGDVVELSGPDYGGRTTRAAAAILGRIENLAHKLPIRNSNFNSIG